MNSVRAIQQLNKRELEAGINPEASWHTDYRDTAFIYVGGLPFELSEGDIIAVFSQYGEPVWIKLARDRETGKSRGFAWIKYEDQRSCDLAVDNLGGSTVLDRVIRVDHARYKPKDDEDMRDNTYGELDLDPGSDSDDGRRKRRKTESESESEDDRPMLPEEVELARLVDKLDEEDPMRDGIIKRQQEKVDKAIEKMKKAKRKEERARKREKRHERERSRDHHRHKESKRIKDKDDNDREHRSSRRRRGSSSEDDRRERRRSASHDRDTAKRRSTPDDRERHRRRSSLDNRDRARKRSSPEDRSRERRRSTPDDRDRKRRQPSSDVEDRTRKRSSRSPLPYRARSP